MRTPPAPRTALDDLRRDLALVEGVGARRAACPASSARSGRRQVSPWRSGLAANTSRKHRRSLARGAALRGRRPARLLRQPRRHRKAARRQLLRPARRSGGTAARPSAEPSRPARAPRRERATASPPRWESSAHRLAVLHVGGRGDRRRRALAKVERVGLPVLGDVDDREAAAADPGRLRVHDAQRQRGGAGGVDRVAARLQAPRPRQPTPMDGPTRPQRARPSSQSRWRPRSGGDGGRAWPRAARDDRHRRPGRVAGTGRGQPRRRAEAGSDQWRKPRA